MTRPTGKALASFLLRRQGCEVVEVNRPDRRCRRRKGTSDAIEAENAARGHGGSDKEA